MSQDIYITIFEREISIIPTLITGFRNTSLELFPVSVNNEEVCVEPKETHKY